MENKFIRMDEVAKELDVSKPYAYKIIRQLNEELKAKGFITIAGRVNRQYFNERLYGAERNKVNASICLLLVHHTRKQQAGDKFEMISGTTGLLGCADGAFLLQKEKRTDLSATLEIVGRDQPDQKLHLTRDTEKLIWQLDHAETELWKKPPDPLLEKIAAVITEDSPVWSGSATELVALLGEDIQPNILTRRLNVKAGDLLNEYSIEYTVKRTRTGSAISLTRRSV